MSKDYTALRERFLGGLQERTSWGRNQVRDLFDDCVIEIMQDELDAVSIDKLVEEGLEEIDVHTELREAIQEIHDEERKRAVPAAEYAADGVPW